MRKDLSLLFAGGLIALLGLGCGAENHLDKLGGKGDNGTGGNTKPIFSQLYDGYFQKCAQCHAPGAPGRTSDTEATLDFSTLDTAYASLTQGSASGLQGNFEGCNGIRFIGSSYENSLIAAVLDPSVRRDFAQGDCTGDSISDMTEKAGPPPVWFLSKLREWIESGAPAD